MDAGQHDHVGIRALGFARQCQAVADDVGNAVEDLRRLIVVRKDDGIAFAFQFRDIRRQIQPDNWATFETESMLGEALLDLKKYTEAEPRLLSGYEGMKQREETMPPQDKPRLTRAVERLVKLYEAWDKRDQATKWRDLLTSSAANQKS